jgi:hypothetical protein
LFSIGYQALAIIGFLLVPYIGQDLSDRDACFRAHRSVE